MSGDRHPAADRRELGSRGVALGCPEEKEVHFKGGLQKSPWEADVGLTAGHWAIKADGMAETVVPGRV